MSTDRRGTSRNWNKPGAYFGVPLPVCVLALLIGGLAIGLQFPKIRAVNALYVSGTYFPKLVVTLAALIVFVLLSGATAKLVLLHRQKARHLFVLILAAYILLALASLIYVALWIPVLTKLPYTLGGVSALDQGEPVWNTIGTLIGMIAGQPLMQVLGGAVVAGYLSATFPSLRSVAHGLVIGSETTLWLFKKLLWYYPIMIGCLAIGIPLKFGVKGMSVYGQTTLWIAIVTMSLSVLMIGFVKATTKRTFGQIFTYLGTVWPTGFGTGGSYETLAMNVVSAEDDLGLRREIAEVSIVFGTVLNKSCATVSVLLVTISVTKLLHIPISFEQILMLIPPILILGLESPGIPGGAGFFMSPIVAVLLHVHDVDVFVAIFVTMYSGLIPMFSTAGNTTNDGLIGAVLNDRFAENFTMAESLLHQGPRAPGSQVRKSEARGMRRLLGRILLPPGAWMLVAPQAKLGLKQLQWMSIGSFGGEALLGILVVCISLYLLSIQTVNDNRETTRTGTA